MGEECVADVVALAPQGGTILDKPIDSKRSLLAEEMLSYFGETCPALAARCEVAIIGLPPLARRDVAERLLTLRAVTNEANRELTAARVTVATGQRRRRACSIVRAHQSSISAKSPRQRRGGWMSC